VNHSCVQSPIETRLWQLRHAKKIWPLAIWGITLLLAPGVACAARSCTITSTSITFSTYDSLSATALASTGTLGFSCTSGVASAINFTVSLATGSSGSYATRTLKSGVNILDYNLYTTVSHTTIWGDATAGTATVTGSYSANNAPPVDVTVYALIPARQNVIAGSYTDSITATVTF
jgi:spore coat protein U-like protein